MLLFSSGLIMYTSSALKETLKVAIFLDECIYPLCISDYLKKQKKVRLQVPRVVMQLVVSRFAIA